MYYILKCCFLCLNYNNNHLISINKKNANNVSVKEMLKICLPEISELEIHETICSNCYKSLNDMYYFKQKCLGTKGSVKKYIKILQQTYFDSTFQNDLDVTLIDIKHLGLIKDKLEYIDKKFKEENSDYDYESSVGDYKSDDSYHSDSIFDEFQYKCEICNKEFIQKYNYLEHIKSHKKIVFCSKKMSNLHKDTHSAISKQLTSILRLETSSNLNYPKKCYNCDKPFAVREQNFLKHGEKVTSKSKYRCSNCNLKFSNKNKRKIFICEFCNKECDNKKDFKQHKFKKHSKNIRDKLLTNRMANNL